MASVTGMVMGRNTYDVVRRNEAWACAKYPCVVATRRPLDGLPDGAEAELLADPRRRGAAGRVWILGGGEPARQFLDAGLLDTIEIGTIPIVLGSGIPAFGGKQADRWLDLTFAKQLANGAVYSQYSVRRASA